MFRSPTNTLPVQNTPSSSSTASTSTSSPRTRPPRRQSTMTPDAYKRALHNNRGGTSPAVTDFTFASAMPHDHVLHSPFASAPPQTFASDAEDADMRFEQELADTDMAQYLSFDHFDAFPSSSSPLSAFTNNGNGSNNALLASPPPPSDADGASPALSFVGSDGGFGFGSPSPGSWSAHTLPLGDAGANTSPRSPPLYSPTHDFSQLSPGPTGLGLGISGGEGGALFANTGYGGYDYGMDPFSFSPCATGDGSSAIGFSNAPWDNLDLLGVQAQSPKADFDASAAQSSQQQQPQQPQLFLPQSSEAMDAPRRSARYAPYTSPAISPRDLELPTPASAPGLSAPSWAAQLWDAPTLSSSSMHPGMLAEHGRSTSEASVFNHSHQMHPGTFVPPPSAPAAIPIPANSSNASANTEFQAYNHSTPALAQIFQQPASAPVQAPMGFMPPSPFGMANVPLDDGSALGTPSAVATRGDGQGHNVSTGSGFRARMRSYSHRVVPSWLDRQRAPFSTRASAGFAQGEAQAIEREVKMKAEDEAVTTAWSSGIGLGLGTSVGGLGEGLDRDREADMSTIRVAWPSSVPTNASTTSLSAGLGLNEADPDATVRRKKRTSSSAQTPSPHIRNALLGRAHSREPSSEKDAASAPASKEAQAALRSELRPPKLAPSTWQLYFTDWIQRHQMLGGADRKLNVAQAAKEAGAEYASLSAEQKEPYKRRSQAAKEARERELAAWQRTLTPEDIKKENAYRAQQRRAGKSRKGNIKDPNAPKKPLSAYFMFLQHIRADPERVRRVFGDEKETTNQSVLAAQTWRAMSDEERKPFLAQAEKEKLDYEAARRMYEEGTVGFETTISFGDSNNAGASSSSTFSAYPTMGMGTTFAIGQPTHEGGSGSDSEQDPEAEGESEGFGTDEERRSPRRL